MDRKRLLELMSAMAAAAALYGCANAPTPQHTADMRQETDTELDTAAMNGCSDQYPKMTRAMARTLAPTCGLDPECTRVAPATAQREATQAATDAVVTERMRVAGTQVLKCE